MEQLMNRFIHQNREELENQGIALTNSGINLRPAPKKAVQDLTKNSIKEIQKVLFESKESSLESSSDLSNISGTFSTWSLLQSLLPCMEIIQSKLRNESVKDYRHKSELYSIISSNFRTLFKDLEALTRFKERNAELISKITPMSQLELVSEIVLMDDSLLIASHVIQWLQSSQTIRIKSEKEQEELLLDKDSAFSRASVMEYAFALLRVGKTSEAQSLLKAHNVSGPYLMMMGCQPHHDFNLEKTIHGKVKNYHYQLPDFMNSLPLGEALKKENVDLIEIEGNSVLAE